MYEYIKQGCLKLFRPFIVHSSANICHFVVGPTMYSMIPLDIREEESVKAFVDAVRCYRMDLYAGHLNLVMYTFADILLIYMSLIAFCFVYLIVLLIFALNEPCIGRKQSLCCTIPGGKINDYQPTNADDNGQIILHAHKHWQHTELSWDQR